MHHSAHSLGLSRRASIRRTLRDVYRCASERGCSRWRWHHLPIRRRVPGRCAPSGQRSSANGGRGVHRLGAGRSDAGVDTCKARGASVGSRVELLWVCVVPASNTRGRSRHHACNLSAGRRRRRETMEWLGAVALRSTWRPTHPVRAHLSGSAKTLSSGRTRGVRQRARAGPIRSAVSNSGGS